MTSTPATDWIAAPTKALGPDLRYPLPSAAPDVRENLSLEDFSKFSENPGLPVVLTHCIDGWAARAKWTFEYFDSILGSKEVIVTDRLGRATKARRTKLSEYLLYCRVPFATSLAQSDTPTPFYLTSFSPFLEFPDLLNDFTDPVFVKNVYAPLEGSMKKWYCENFGWIFIGPRGTLSPLHIDLFGTHAWLAQIVGRKRFLLFPPSDAGYLYNGAVDLVAPDLDRHPLQAEARPVEVVLEPGQLIFIPAGWAHQVISLTPSISLTFNFVDASNYLRHVLSVCRDLPAWTKKISSRDFRLANGHAWTSDGFSFEQRANE